MSSLIFKCVFNCAEVAEDCASTDPDAPENVIESAKEDIAQAENDIAEQTQNKNDAESFDATIEMVEGALSSENKEYKKKNRKRMREFMKTRGHGRMSSISISIKTCSEFDTKYLEFLDLLENISDENIVDLRGRRDIIIATALTLNNICSKDQKIEIKIKASKKKDSIKIKIKGYKKKKDDDIVKLLDKLLELWEAIKEANDQLAAQGKPTISPPTTEEYTYPSTTDASETSSVAGTTSSAAGTTVALVTTVSTATTSEGEETTDEITEETTTEGSGEESGDPVLLELFI